MPNPHHVPLLSGRSRYDGVVCVHEVSLLFVSTERNKNIRNYLIAFSRDYFAKPAKLS